jgi:hypothetical protein
MKICIRCHKEKELKSFGNHPTAKDGKRNQCEACRYELRKARPTYKTQIKAYRALRYGITLEEFEEFLSKQNNACSICEEAFIKTPHIDHDHKTKKVRGLLCSNCNTMLGLAKDSPQILERAIRYLTSKP